MEVTVWGRGCVGVGVSVCLGVLVGGWVGNEGVLIRFVLRSLRGGEDILG